MASRNPQTANGRAGYRIAQWPPLCFPGLALSLILLALITSAFATVAAAQSGRRKGSTKPSPSTSSPIGDQTRPATSSKGSADVREPDITKKPSDEVDSGAVVRVS